ncbi:hypothetical protein F4814DRAFT_13177 [Daldinia grandis]|nr:hypothetical protein F4814DRAFT_13177 [Daldinia grandis]
MAVVAGWRCDLHACLLLRGVPILAGRHPCANHDVISGQNPNPGKCQGLLFIILPRRPSPRMNVRIGNFSSEHVNTLWALASRAECLLACDDVALRSIFCNTTALSSGNDAGGSPWSTPGRLF